MLRELSPSQATRERELPRRGRRTPSSRVLRARQTALEIALLGLIAALVPLRHSWAAQAALIVLLLVAPGAVLLRALRVPGDAVLATPVYVPCASLVVLLAAGLGVDLVAPQLGIAMPLRAWPLLAGFEALSVVLLVLAAAAPLGAGIPWRILEPRVWRAWPLLLPVLAAAGALRLTQGHSAAMATAALVAVGAALVAGVVVAERVSNNQLALLLYGAALAAAWSFSLRGHFPYGFDVASEFHIVTNQWAAGAWHPSRAHDAYSAMLSLTVLPSTLHALAGISSLALLKAVYPALLALFPVALFAIASRFLSRRYAFVAAAFVVVQSYFFQQMPAIARQEIALLMFVALVAAVLDHRLPRRAQWPLVVLLGLAVAVSHYSTTYLALAMFGVAAVVYVVLWIARRRPAAGVAVILAFLATAGGAAVWYAPVTHSTSNVAGFTSNLRERGLDLLPNAKRGQSPVAAYLFGNSESQVSAREYQALAASEYAKTRRYVTPLPSARAPRYVLENATPAGNKESPRPSALLRYAQLVAGQLANALAVIAALALVLRRRTPAMLRLVGVLGASTLLVLAFVRLSGTAANAYNQERAFVQTMVPLSVGMAWLLQAMATRWRRLAPILALLVAGGLAVIFVGGSGLRAVALGGDPPANLANHGEDYERFYLTAPDLASARWVAGAPHGSMVYADRYGQLRVLAATGRSQGVLLDVTPRTLDRHAWVYASRTNFVDRRARGEIGLRYSVYRWPARFLDEQLNTVYSNGSSVVYHR